MATRTLRLKISILTCLLAVWTHCPAAPASASPPAAEGIAATTASQPQAGEPDDPLAIWFKQQDTLLDDIMMRLARIELLVADIHRLLSQLPDGTQPRAEPPAVARSAPPAPPAPARVMPTEAPPVDDMASTLVDWAPQLAGGLLVLLLLWWSRRRPKTGQGATSKAKVAATPTAAVVDRSAPAAPAHPQLTEVPQAPGTAPLPVRPQPEKSQPEAAPVKPASTPQPSADIEFAHADLDIGSGETDQAIELADIMLSMGLGHGAAQTLAEQIRNEPKQALRHWLKLLEVYRQNGQQDEFERSAEELRLHFNVQPEDWNAEPDALRTIEDYPHIAQRITELWGTPSCETYLQNLLADNRGGSRAGFPQPVAEEFLLIVALNRIVTGTAN